MFIVIYRVYDASAHQWDNDCYSIEAAQSFETIEDAAVAANEWESAKGQVALVMPSCSVAELRAMPFAEKRTLRHQVKEARAAA